MQLNTQIKVKFLKQRLYIRCRIYMLYNLKIKISCNIFYLIYTYFKSMHTFKFGAVFYYSFVFSEKGRDFRCRTTKISSLLIGYRTERSDNLSLLQPINKLEIPCRTTHEISAKEWT